MYEFGWPLSNQGFIIRSGKSRLIGTGDTFGMMSVWKERRGNMSKLIDDVEDRYLRTFVLL